MVKYLLVTFIILTSINAYSLIVIKPEYKGKIQLKIVRAMPESFETYSLTNHNGREMTLVCAHNKAYENNKLPFIEYRNFYNEIAGQFILESDQICKEMGKFIEQTHDAIDEWRPFLITLDKSSLKVEKIIYPKIDPLAETGDVNDLYPKKNILDFPRPNINFPPAN